MWVKTIRVIFFCEQWTYSFAIEKNMSNKGFVQTIYIPLLFSYLHFSSIVHWMCVRYSWTIEHRSAAFHKHKEPKRPYQSQKLHLTLELRFSRVWHQKNWLWSQLKIHNWKLFICSCKVWTYTPLMVITCFHWLILIQKYHSHQGKHTHMHTHHVDDVTGHLCMLILVKCMWEASTSVVISVWKCSF